MANRNVGLVLKRSNVVDKVPLTSDLQLGEAALNTADAKLYSLYTSGNTTPIDVREISWDKLPLTGGTINGNLIIDGNLSASTISGLSDTNEFTTGGTFVSSAGTITFSTNSGNTFDINNVDTIYNSNSGWNGISRNINNFDNSTFSLKFNDGSDGTSSTRSTSLEMGSGQLTLARVSSSSGTLKDQDTLMLFNNDSITVITSSTGGTGLNYFNDYSSTQIAGDRWITDKGYVDLTISASTSGLTDTNEFTTGGTYTQSAGTITYTSNSANTYDVSGLNIYGTEFNLLQSTGVSITTSTTFQQKINDNTGILPIGLYKLMISYGWSHDGTTSDFESRVSFDGNFIGVANNAGNDNNLIHKQEPKDSAGNPNGSSDLAGAGTIQRYGFVYNEYINVTTPGIKPIILEYRTDVDGVESTIWNANIEIIRVQ